MIFQTVHESPFKIAKDILHIKYENRIQEVLLLLFSICLLQIRYNFIFENI